MINLITTLKSVFCLLQSFLFLVSSFSVYDSNFKEWVDAAAIDVTSAKNISFAPISADEVKVSDEEKAACREWFDKNIINAGTNGTAPAYNFKVGGKSLKRNLGDWKFTPCKESETGAVRTGGKTTYITVTHKKSDLAAMVEATIYEDNATCEWTVYIKNNGDGNSQKITDFYGADTTVKTGLSELYVSNGSSSDADDFELRKTNINLIPMIFNANGGRTSSYLPYFNICGAKQGIVMTVGWSGQWKTEISQTLTGVRIKAMQEYFSGYLTPGEEVRTPLVTLSFYSGRNALKGFNTLRNWEMDCVYPEYIRPATAYVIANEFSKKTTDEFIDEINNLDKRILDNVEYFWMDAGWYEYNEGWHDGVGNWTADKSRFPDGLAPLGETIKNKGKRFLLWYEPERVRENTILYNEGLKHENWTITDGDNTMWNLGNEDAFRFLSEYISASLKENGVGVYRQDFNFTPLPYWQKSDKEFCDGRKGITENHYITNLYRYLDYLIETNEGLIIDNCASGGRRIETEMTRRSVPMWRSDYNCGNADGSVKPDVLEATQGMTYGLSFWVPMSGTNYYTHNEYAERTGILTHPSVYQPNLETFGKYNPQRDLMIKNYYPLDCGRLSEKKYIGMQYGDETEGTALVYKREKVKKDEYTLVLNGLSSDVVYQVYDIDDPDEIFKKSGAELMKNGIDFTISETPKAKIFMYKAINS